MKLFADAIMLSMVAILVVGMVFVFCSLYFQVRKEEEKNRLLSEQIRKWRVL